MDTRTTHATNIDNAGDVVVLPTKIKMEFREQDPAESDDTESTHGLSAEYQQSFTFSTCTEKERQNGKGKETNANTIIEDKEVVVVVSDNDEDEVAQPDEGELEDTAETDTNSHISSVAEPLRPALKFKNTDPDTISKSRRCWRQLPSPDLEALFGDVEASLPASQSNQDDSITTKRAVVFTTITFRYYDITLGDNPSVSYGPPIQLDWTYEEEEESRDLDIYEATRKPRRPLRRLVLNFYQRKNLLQWQYGFTEEQLKQAKRDAKKIKKQRHITTTFLHAQLFEEIMESAIRKTKRIMGKKAPPQQQQSNTKSA